jgi:tetratricopeptide (TPR) repeat protein
MKLKVFLIIPVLLIISAGCSKSLPKDYVEHVNHSQQFIDENNLDQALIEVEEALSIDSEAPEAYVQKGFIHLAKGEINQAKEALTYVSNHLDDFLEEESLYAGLLNIGNLNYQLEDYTLALDYFLKALDINDLDPILYNAMGLCYISLGDLENAKVAYSKAIDLDNENFYAYGNLASVFLREGEIKRGLNEINTALNLNSYIPQFYLIKGELLIGDNRSGEAIMNYSNAIGIWDTFGDAYFKRGELYLDNEDYLNAINDFSYAKDYGMVEGLLGMGYSYKGLQQYDQAITAFSEYLANLESIDLKAVYEIAIMYYQLEDYNEAINAIDELLKLEPNDTEALLIKAYSYEKLIQYEKALEVLNIILSIDPNHEKAIDEVEFMKDNNLR